MFKSLYPLFFLVIFMSCGTDDDMTSTPVDPIMEAIDLEEVGINLQLWQDLRGDNDYVILASNIEPIECLNTFTPSIESTSPLDISFSATQDEAPCPQRDEIVEERIEVADLEGEFDLRIFVGDAINVGAVVFDEDRMELKLRTKDGLVINEESINRIPEDIAWGYASLTTDEQDIAFLYGSGVIASPSPISPEIPLVNGNYGYFNYAESDERFAMINGQTDWGQAIAVDISRDNGWEELGQILRGLETEFPSMTYYFANSESEVYEKL